MSVKVTDITQQVRVTRVERKVIGRQYTVALSEREAALLLAIVGAQPDTNSELYSTLAKAMGDEIRENVALARPAFFTLAPGSRLREYLNTLSDAKKSWESTSISN